MLVFASLASVLASPWPDDQDGVNFLLGLESYDVVRHQPHFPGYPVYILAGKIFNNIIAAPEWALIALSVFSGVASISLMARMTGRYYGYGTGLICAAAFAFNTVFFEFSHKIFSEIPALTLLLTAVYTLDDPKTSGGKNFFTAGVFLGLMLGIRLSWWPFPFFYMLYGLRVRRGVMIFGGLFCGIALWLIPQVSVTGAAELLLNGWSFTLGHFFQWGTGAGFYIAPKFFLLALRIVEALGFTGSGIILTRLPWIIFSLYCFYILLSRKKLLRGHRFKTFFMATLFYIAWVAVGQNLEKVRHLIPVIPAVILAIAPVIDQHRKTAAAAVAILALTLPVDYASRVFQKPPGARFLLWTDSESVPGTVYYCGPSERIFDNYPSNKRVVSVKRAAELDHTLKASWPAPEKVYTCSDIPGFESENAPAVIFPARKGDPVDRTLSIYPL
ncbi:MAG: hypothetical protein IEMM0002_0257 [bacterium]|nr:MAG: hypothetical protein IEMM0002_0257 [bacterium]